ncbi:MAG TPA: alpha/beta hydrolase [Candidatus Nitrosocosmicus sp.]|nr:alpha/beta hydrolase [Candidatus Nitrosocosmicus sp.]
MQYVIFHGSYGGPSKNWFPYLKQELENKEHTVIVPTFPCDNWEDVTRNGPSIPLQNQNLRNWLEMFEKTFETIDTNIPLCFIGHSLGCVFILHILERYNIILEKAIFVAPFLEKLNGAWQIDHANETFYKTDFNFMKLQQQIEKSYVIYSDNDPYVPMNYSLNFSKNLESVAILLEGAGHMNDEVNMKEFPLLVDLCVK